MARQGGFLAGTECRGEKSPRQPGHLHLHFLSDETGGRSYLLQCRWVHGVSMQVHGAWSRMGARRSPSLTQIKYHCSPDCES